MIKCEGKDCSNKADYQCKPTHTSLVELLYLCNDCINKVWIASIPAEILNSFCNYREDLKCL